MLKGHFVPSSKGNVFVTQFGNIKNDVAILCLPSITEELNLSRAVVAKTAMTLSNKAPVFVLDYFGTGDSSGEFEQATTDIWIDDIVEVSRWLKTLGIKKIIIWGVRFGALLSLQAQIRIKDELTIKQFVFWKPVTNGKQFAGQFLRIKQANTMMNSGEKINWRQHILDGKETEVAGYIINNKMLVSLEALKFTAKVAPAAQVNWFELAANELTPATKRSIAQWPESSIETHAIDCPMFWQVPEIFSLAHLSEQTYKVII